MSNDYQAIYDAVRSRIGNVDVHSAVREAFSAPDWSYLQAIVSEEVAMVRNEMIRPSVLYRPRLERHEKGWFAIYGRGPAGVVGNGSSPAEACADFDRAWFTKIAQPEAT